MSYNRWTPPEYSSELYHHGVKGMRWGVRKRSPKPILSRIKEINSDYEERRATEWARLVENPRKKASTRKEAFKQYIHEAKVTGNLVPSYAIKKGREWTKKHSSSMDHMQLHQMLTQQAMSNAIATHQMMVDMHMQTVHMHTSPHMY